MDRETLEGSELDQLLAEGKLPPRPLAENEDPEPEIIPETPQMALEQPAMVEKAAESESVAEKAAVPTTVEPLAETKKE